MTLGMLTCMGSCIDLGIGGITLITVAICGFQESSFAILFGVVHITIAREIID
jgi:hypothetical protein